MTGRASPARLAAHAVLRDVAGGSFADLSAERRLAGLEPRDRALAQELAYGCLRLRGRLDAELARLVDRPLEALDPAVLDWLRLGLYQLRELRVPDHAAVNESVEGARATGAGRAAGLVNAVLRGAARSDGARPSPEEPDPVARLTRWGSHPEWLVRRWLERWPVADVERLVELDDVPPPVVVRIPGPAGASLPGWARSDPHLSPLPGWPRSFRLEGAEPERWLAERPAIVQDPAASAVVDYLGRPAGGPVLDACAAPGGKAIALAAAAPSARPFVAADRSPRRLRSLVETARRLGSDVRAVAMDARAPAIRLARTVLVDAPCSGTGALRRRPDARWRLEAAGLSELVELQGRLLDALAGIVAPEGLLVYATCSLEAEENERQVDAFLARHPGFRREPPPSADALPAGALTDRGDLFIRPWAHGVDGAYAARLRRGGS